MKNKLTRTLSIFGLLATSLVSLGSCGNKGSYDYTYFYGLCETSGDLNDGVDYAITNDWIGDRVNALGCKSMRLWVSINALFTVTEDNDLKLNNHYYTILKDHVDKLYRDGKGVTNFLAMYTTFLFPYGYAPTTLYCVPDPTNEHEEYEIFLNLMEKGSQMFAELFPMIKYFEPGNEPDLKASSCIHKNGYGYGLTERENAAFLYTDDEKANIVCDICYYTRRGIKKASKDNKCSMISLCLLDRSPHFLELIYQGIESQTLPYGTEKSDTDPDNYFDILNWHPYPGVTTGNPDPNKGDWVGYQKEIYQVAIDHGDGDKPVYYSELGWTDNGVNTTKADNSKYLIDALKLIKENLPFVEAVFVFRLTNLVHQNVSVGENNFGLFYNPDDPDKNLAGQPKQIAIDYAKFINGDDYIIPPYEK